MDIVTTVWTKFECTCPCCEKINSINTDVIAGVKVPKFLKHTCDMCDGVYMIETSKMGESLEKNSKKKKKKKIQVHKRVEG